MKAVGGARRVVAAAGLVVATALVVPPTAAPTYATQDTSVPVVDAFVIDVPAEDGSAVTRFEGAIHGAYRLPAATVVYWSLRESGEAGLGLAAALEYEDVDLIGGVLADPGSLDVLLPMRDDQGCLCTEAEDVGETVESTRFQVMYTTFPPVPAATSAIDIDVDGRGTIIAGVPVHDSLPPGEQVPAAVVPMGAGWPGAPSTEQIGGAEASAAQDLVGRSSALDGSVTTEGTGTDRLVRFDADVLFDFDRSNLNRAAEEVLASAADTLQEAEATHVEIVGHTDGMGTEEHNQELSEDRAETVAEELRDALGGDVDYAVEGRGWDEPIASNATDEGRAKNRRVTISYSSDGGEE